MKIRYPLLLLASLLICVIVNSCKKQQQYTISTLFTGGSWQLASVMAFHYVGNQLIATDTLNTKCNQTQLFTFNSNNTCTYTNFDCITQTSSAAPWTLAQNQLYLQANVVCKDTTAIGSSMPFSNAAIINLGQYSLVLQTGDIQPNYSLTAPRRILQFGFVRVKAP